MLRQNRSEGSSTSRSFAKPALFPALRKTFQFSYEQCPRYIFMAEPLFLIPSVPAEVQESGPYQRCHTFFGRNHFSSCRPPAEPVRLEATREIGFARLDRHTIFEGTTFPRSFRLRSVCPAPPADRLAE